MGFERFTFDADNGAILAFREDETVFVALSDQIRQFAAERDPGASLDISTVIDALDAAWDANRNLFRAVTPRAAPAVNPLAGMAMDLTAADRARLHAIIDKHHRQYFASWPTPAQKDNLIDALGPIVARRIVTEALKSNRIH